MTDINETPGRLDLYVEKIVSYMNLDDAQRDDVVRELRSHLEEAIEEATRQGMNRDRAETVAMERFGDPAMLAGQFGTLQGKMWVVFEAMAYSLTFFAIYQILIRQLPNRPDFITNTHLIIIAVIAAALALTARLWNRVQVNGSLRIYRFLSPTQVIPFDAISDVHLERLHLVGPRKINIRYGNGRKARFSSAWPNARCVGIALEVLAPQAIQPKATEFFRQLRLKSGTESFSVKLSFTTGWIILGILMAAAFPIHWSGEGLSLAYALAFLGTGGIMSLQQYAHSDRAKRSILLVLLFGLIFFLLPWSGYAFLGPTDTRPTVMLMSFLLPLPLALLWWRGRNRLLLFTLVVAWVAAGYMAALRVPREVKLRPRSVGVVNGFLENGVWVSGSTADNPVFAAIGNYKTPRDHASRAMLTLTRDNQTTSTLLDQGYWYIVAGGSASPLTLLSRDERKATGDSIPATSTLYRLTADGQLDNVAELPATSSHQSALVRPGITVSPDGRYYLTTAVDVAVTAGESARYYPALLDMTTRQLARLDHVKLNTPLRWITSSTLEFAVSKTAEDDKPVLGEYEVWQLDTESGEFTSTGRTLDFGSNVYLSRHSSSTHAICWEIRQWQ